MKNWKITNFYQFLKPIFKIRKIRILDLWGKMSESPMWNQFLKNHWPLPLFWSNHQVVELYVA